MKKNKFIDFFSNFKKIASWGSQENWKIIALCFLGATIFWFFNALNKEYTARIRYPVEFRFNEDDVIVVDELPDEVRLEARGGGWNLLKKTFWFNINPIELSLENPTEVKVLTGRSIRPFVVDQITEITVNDVITDTLRINIEKKVSKMLSLRVDSAGIRLADNHRIVSPIRYSTDSILITGPQSRVNAFGESLVLSITNALIDSDYQETVDLAPYFPPKVTVSPDEATIAFDVEEFVEIDKELIVEPVNFPENPPVVLEDSTVVASIFISRQDLDKLGSGDFTVVADYSAYSRGDSLIRVDLVEYPDFIAEITLNEDSIRLSHAP